MILNENPIIWSHVQFFNFWSNFHCSYMILVVELVCQVWEFKHLHNSESHDDWESRRKLIKMHNQDSRKFSSLLIFKLSFCDSSPSLITSRWWIFKSWSNELYSSEFNSVSCYEFHDPKGRHEKRPILRFLVRPVVILQLPIWLSTKIFKSHYLGFCSSYFKTEDSLIEIIHGQKPILRFWVFHLQKFLWLFNFR